MLVEGRCIEWKHALHVVENDWPLHLALLELLPVDGVAAQLVAPHEELAVHLAVRLRHTPSMTDDPHSERTEQRHPVRRFEKGRSVEDEADRSTAAYEPKNQEARLIQHRLPR